MLKNVLLAGAAAVALAAIAAPAHANVLSTNQWYAGHFTASNTPLLAGGVPGSHGPILPGGTAPAITAPTAGNLSATFVLPSGGYLLVTDVETSGDRFTMSVNGNPAVAAPAGATGLVPGGQQSVGDDTSVPVPFGDTGVTSISVALLNADYSSGTFYLPPGSDTVTGEFIGVIQFGDMDFIVEPAIPEPATLSILGLGLAGLGAVRRRRR